jgi:hypothetical protein
LRAECNGLGQITLSARIQNNSDKRNKQIREKLNKLKLFNLKGRKLSMDLQTELTAEAYLAKGQ